MTELHATGFVIARQEQGEADLWLQLFLDDGRVCRVVAKSGSRSVRRFAGALSPFTLYRFLFGRGARSSRPRLDEAAVARPFPGVIAELRRTAAAGAATTLVRDLTGEGAANPHLFELYLDALDRLENAGTSAAGCTLVRFAVATFIHGGYPFVLDSCVRCGREAPDNARVTLSPHWGGVVCAACGGGALELSAAERRDLRAALAGNEGSFGPAMLECVAAMIEPHVARGAESMRRARDYWHDS